MTTTPTPKLFQPIKVGNVQLQHRVVFGPSTRLRADKDHVPLPHVKDYYAQRGSVPGTLLISEATFIAPEAGGSDYVPGIWSEAQVKAWSEVTKSVHEAKSFIFLQLWALGRAGNADILKREGFSLVSASDIPLSGKGTPRPLTISEIHHYKTLYAKAAANAIRAGFDGVEIHGANGYLLDQFMQDVSNKRTDEYGGTIENRCRFTLEVVDAVSKEVGQERTAIRISPWGIFQAMRMKDPEPTFSYLVSHFKKDYPKMAYLHLVEPRGNTFVVDKDIDFPGSNDFIRDIWRPNPLITCGGYHYDPQVAIDTAEKKDDIIAFSRAFIANPDLPYRIQHGIPLTEHNRAMFYRPNSMDPDGYTDYPFAMKVKKTSSDDDSKL